MMIDPSFDQRASSYLKSLTHLHSANGHGLPVCSICRGPTGVKNSSGEHWPICPSCKKALSLPGIGPGELADATGFIVYALQYSDGAIDQSLQDMYQYKQHPPKGIQTPTISGPGQRIRTLLYVTLRDSLPLFALRGFPVEVITEVPSTSSQVRRDPRALADAIDSVVSKFPVSAPHVSLLLPEGGSSGFSRLVAPDRFSVMDPDQVAGRHVLVVEDTWVSGASAQSAAVSLHRAGAVRVTVLSVARMITEQWQDGRYLTSGYRSFRPPSPDLPVF